MTTTPEALRDAGIATRENAADPRLILAVDAVIARWVESGRRFSANEIRDEVPTLAADLVGPRLRAASMRKPTEIVKVGEVRSSLLSTHAKPIAVWQSAAVVAAERAA
jgi:hypothetical protein